MMAKISSSTHRVRTAALLRSRRSFAFALHALACAVFATLLVACPQPKQDKFVEEGGISPDPTARIDGTVLYLGPKPSCRYDGNKVTHINGRVVMLLFQYDNPPPPEGGATTALNLLFVRGDELFSAEDCLGPTEKLNLTNPAQQVVRSVDFHWAEIPLGSTPTSYQVRAFFDYDEDMNPFFSVTNLPTAGDIGGGAVKDLQDPDKGFAAVSIPALSQAKNGFIRKGITVGINAPVWTERPAFAMSPKNRFLAADQFVPAAPLIFDGAVHPELFKTIDDTWGLSCGTQPPAANCGFSAELLTEKQAGAVYDAAGLSLDFNNDVEHAFYAEPFDVVTIVKKGPDLNASDGIPDPHPVLGTSTSLGLPWFQPAVVMQRLPLVQDFDPANPDKVKELANATTVETQAGIPAVALLGTPLVSETLDPDCFGGAGKTFPPGTSLWTDKAKLDTCRTKRTFTNSINVAIAPVAVLDLWPGHNECRVPYIPYGPYGVDAAATATSRTSTLSYESRVIDCRELPTGFYKGNVLAGMAASPFVKATDATQSPNGYIAPNSRYSGQAWTVPNDLADPNQVGSAALASQGWGQLFVVHDPNPKDDAARRKNASDPYCKQSFDPLDVSGLGDQRDIKFKKLCVAGENPLSEDEAGVDGTACLPSACCDPIAHLCKVPQCEWTKIDNKNVQKSPTRIVSTDEHGRKVPDCIPFALPAQCCGG
jgi:hypothetical protein